ncbi:LamG-like jellyroll fold domain-containing protein [Streptomyces koyangensis]|uniref:LamG-like jellyroll fold domain-containing protein n=1 Tax=Streptomyces koyangensis TaxID=188770 RepID=UPI003C2BEB84
MTKSVKKNRQVRLRRGTVIGLSLMLLSGAFGTGGVGPAPATADSAPAARQTGVDEARAAAVQTGEPVEVTALRDERSDTLANPDGTFTTRTYAQAVRTVKDGKWAEIDATLVRGAGGRLETVATPAVISLSGGGDRSFAVLGKESRSLALSWPQALPEPEVAGDTAVYAEVLPGVDLRVTADPEGLSHVLVVKSPEAARQPALDQIDIGLTTRDLRIATTEDGGLQAVDEGTGGVVFEAAQPVMWDSSTQSTAGAVAKRSAGQSSEESTGDPVEAHESGRVSDVGLEVAGEAMSLTPDETLLRGEDTVYPVYIDPVVRTANRTGWTMVSSHHSSAEFWKFDDHEGVGRCPADVSYQCASGNDVKRQFFAMPTGSFEGKDIISAEFAVTMVHTYSSSGKAVELGRVNSAGGSAISSSTNWGNQPSQKELIDSKSPSNAAGSCTRTNQNVRFNVKSTVQKAADSGWGTTTFRLKAGSESDYSYWKRFCGNAHLEVTYNRPPLQPAMSDLTMAPGGACEYGKAEDHYVAEPPKLRASIKDLDHGDADGNSESIKAQFRVFWTKDGKEYEHFATTKPVSTRNAPGSTQTGLATFGYTVGSDLAGDGEAGFTVPKNVVVGWAVRGNDGSAWGPWSLAGDATRCEFIYDNEAPKAPVISSDRYPDDEEWHAGVGDYGTFTFASSSADTAEYRIRFRGETWRTVRPAKTGGAVSVRWMPPDEGPMYVEAKAVDGAGNARVTTTAHTFLVADGRAPKAGWSLGDPRGSSAASGIGETPDALPGRGVTFGSEGPLGPTDVAASFDGSADAYLESAQPAVDTSGTFTVSAWVNLPERPKDDLTLVSQDGTGQPGFDLGYDVDTESWTFRVPVTDMETMGTWKVSGASAVPGSWTHLIGVYDSHTGMLSLFVNGDLIEDDVQARRTVWKADGPVQIGRKMAPDGYTANLKGALADVKLYDRVIPEAEGEDLGGVSATQLGYWALDEAAGADSPDVGTGRPLKLANGALIYRQDDSCDPGLDPTCVPASPPLWGDGHLALDGAGGHASREAGLLAPEDSFTVTARARLASSGGADQTVFALHGASGSAVDVSYSATADRWQVTTTDKDGGSLTSTAAAPGVLPSTGGDGDHLALVYSAVFGDVALYVNGTLALKVPWDNAWDFTTTSLQVGRTQKGTATAKPFSGALDEVRVFRGALDAALIPTVAGLPAGSNVEDTVT